MPAGTKDGWDVMIAFGLGLLVLLLYPVCTVVDDGSTIVEKKHVPIVSTLEAAQLSWAREIEFPKVQRGGKLVYQKAYSTLEVSGIAALRLNPALRPVVQSALFVGVAVRQLNKMGTACYKQKDHQDCNWTVVSIKEIWAAADIRDEDLDEWHKAVGDKHGLISAACAAVNFGGLTGLFVGPDVIVTGGLVALFGLLLFTPFCLLDVSLVIMCILGVIMVLCKKKLRRQ